MTLYIVPVPIGNLQDITARAVCVLKDVDFIIAEDTRHTAKLLNHLGIKKRLISYYKHREHEKAPAILELLKKGHTAALVSDSGTAAISDPGLVLVKAAIEQNMTIIPLPGPTALIPALVASGLATGSFLFLGFPPRQAGELRRYLREIIDLPYTLIFYESPQRIRKFLAAAAEIFGNRHVAIAKELSKIHEQILRGTLADAQTLISDDILKGEFVVVIAGSDRSSRTPAAEDTPIIASLEDIYTHFKDRHGIHKNQIKRIIMKR